MTLQLTTRRLAVAAALAVVCALYLADLNGMGMVSKDEPRYADIGRAMARSGDWITPRLFGQPWFEKPALLYWLIGIGFELRLGNDLAPRLPIALLSLAFLTFFWFRVRSLWNVEVASYSTAILATTAGWLAYSHVAVTDLPLAALFSMAVLFSLDPNRRAARPFAAAALALATLTKSLVPLVLFVPVLAVNFRTLREWLRPLPILVFTVIALPWYILCFLRNGREFIRVLFVQQQFDRLHSATLQHVQPVWFYVPVMLMLLYPWIPLLILVPRNVIPRNRRDHRVLTLSAVVVFGFLFFSATLNKLPSYVLPLLPSTCILMGLGLANARGSERILALPVALLAALPAAARALPAALAGGIRTSPIDYRFLALSLAAGAVAAAMVLLFFRGKVFVVAAALAAVSLLWFQFAAFPAIDTAASARPLWLASKPACASALERGLVYGLEYYAGKSLTGCAVDQAAPQIVR